MKSTNTAEYRDRLVRESGVWWKQLLDVQRPYRWNLQRLRPGKTLDVGCGIGRHLHALPTGSLGVDHNQDSIAEARARGLNAVTSAELEERRADLLGTFDSLLFSHILEHMRREEAIAMVRSYLPFLRAQGDRKLVLITPQEAGYRSDATHVEFTDFRALTSITSELGLEVSRSFSFPFPRWIGHFFPHNEFVVVARYPSP